jgi:eukaryotic-like serine/threonine-protein kinase
VPGVIPDQAFTIGDYVLDPTPIESGAFGTVYNARRRSDGKRVALKLVLSTAEPDSADKLAAERRGAELQQQFGRSHGMVPEVYEYGAHHKHFYIAMEFVEGGSLAHLIAAGPMAPTAAAAHAVCICEFLDKAHQFLTIEGEPGNAIVHADLKPQHILLPRAGEIRVLDFGIAKALAKTRQVTTNI